MMVVVVLAWEWKLWEQYQYCDTYWFFACCVCVLSQLKIFTKVMYYVGSVQGMHRISTSFEVDKYYNTVEKVDMVQ